MSELKFVREYENYEKYLEHQSIKSKDPAVKELFKTQRWESRYKWFYAKFRRTFKEIMFSRKNGRAALCLGARYGHEVQALRDMEFDAIGIDIVPCKPLVIQGDIHNLEFEDRSQNVVFTNIFDHSIYPNIFIEEIHRVLRPGGVAIIHLAIDKSTDEFGVIELVDSSPVLKLFSEASDYLIKNQLTDYAGQYAVLINRAFPRKWGGLNWEVVVQKR